MTRSLVARTGHVNKMARRGEVSGHPRVYASHMHSRMSEGSPSGRCETGHRDGVSALFARMGERPRERRFCGAKPRLGARAREPRTRRWRPPRPRRLCRGDPRPRHRASRDSSSAETPSRSPTSTRAAASVDPQASSRPTPARWHYAAHRHGVRDNPRIVALLQRLGSMDARWRGGEREFVVGL